MSARHPGFTNTVPKNTVGLVLAFEFVMDFLTWADGWNPTWKQIMEHWQVSRATAFRYQSALQRWKEMNPGRKFPRSHRAS